MSPPKSMIMFTDTEILDFIQLNDKGNSLRDMFHQRIQRKVNDRVFYFPGKRKSLRETVSIAIQAELGAI